jgi:hypothetical protein
VFGGTNIAALSVTSWACASGASVTSAASAAADESCLAFIGLSPVAVLERYSKGAVRDNLGLDARPPERGAPRAAGRRGKLDKTTKARRRKRS